MTAPTILDLTTETLLNIQDSLSYVSRLALRLTYRDLHARVSATNEAIHDPVNSTQSTTRNYVISDLSEIELWPEYNGAQYELGQLKQAIRRRDYFACYICLKIRCASQFSNAMMKGKRGKIGQGTTADRAGRFCVPCGLANGRYQRGVSFQLGGAFGGYGFVCRKCGDFKRVEICRDFQGMQRICTACQ